MKFCVVCHPGLVSVNCWIDVYFQPSLLWVLLSINPIGFNWTSKGYSVPAMFYKLSSQSPPVFRSGDGSHSGCKMFVWLTALMWKLFPFWQQWRWVSTSGAISYLTAHFHIVVGFKFRTITGSASVKVLIYELRLHWFTWIIHITHVLPWWKW
jgi:hypothetical protein